MAVAQRAVGLRYGAALLGGGEEVVRGGLSWRPGF